MNKSDKKDRIRHGIQLIWTFITNSYLIGFKEGKIYTGELKKLCLPGLNCYSCPGALGSCPIGSMQAVVGSRQFKFSLYVSGFLIFIGALTGRFVCGWLCPFGLLQDLLYKIPFVKKNKSFRADALLRKLKYVIFLLFVIVLPAFFVDETGLGEPFFCKWICPAGTFEGSIPLMLVDSALRSTIGFLYKWKLLILSLIILLSVIVYRPFCKYICPLGAVYSLFNGVSLMRIKKNEEKCTSCGLCNKACNMNVDVMKNPNTAECIRCGRCITACSSNALSGLVTKTKTDKGGE